MNVCPILASATVSLKNRNPQQNISYSTKTPNSKKKFWIDIITIISKHSIKSSVNGFRQISYEQEKKFLMSPSNLKQTQKVSLYNKSKQYYNHSSKMFSFLFFFFFNLCTVYLKKMFVLSFSFFSYSAFNNIQVSFLSFSFFFHLHCPVAFFFLFVFFCFHFF